LTDVLVFDDAQGLCALVSSELAEGLPPTAPARIRLMRHASRLGRVRPWWSAARRILGSVTTRRA